MAGPELEYCRQQGYIIDMGEWVLYEMAPALAWAQHVWYTVRCEAEEARDRIVASWAKACAVGLVGRFARKDFRWEATGIQRSVVPFGEWFQQRKGGPLERYRSVYWNEYREVPDGWNEEACPAVTSWITSYGRMHLWERLRHVWPDNVIYCDTDSLMVDRDGLFILHDNGLIKPSTWGELTIKERSNDVYVYGAKHYCFGDRLVCAGLAVNPDCDFPRLPCRTSKGTTTDNRKRKGGSEAADGNS